MRWAAVIIVGLLAVGETRADVPPSEPGVAWGYPLHVIETGMRRIPEYVFVIHQRFLFSGEEQKAWYVELTSDNPITVRLRYGESKGLLIVPRAAAEAYKSALDLAHAVERGQVPGATQHWFEFRMRVPAWHAGGIIITYHPQEFEDGSGMELVQTNWKHPLRELNLVVGFLAVAVVLGGIWLVRRRRRATAAVAARSV